MPSIFINYFIEVFHEKFYEPLHFYRRIIVTFVNFLYFSELIITISTFFWSFLHTIYSKIGSVTKICFYLIAITIIALFFSNLFELFLIFIEILRIICVNSIFLVSSIHFISLIMELHKLFYSKFIVLLQIISKYFHISIWRHFPLLLELIWTQSYFLS